MQLRDLVIACYKAIGQSDPDPQSIRSAEMSLTRQFAGERIYITARPRERTRQLAHQAGHDARKLAKAAGISERHARRVLRGR